MPLKASTGNMYSFISHTWNPVRGDCGYGCQYCYVRKWGKSIPLRIDEKCLRDDLGESNYIFICSGCDLFHPNIPDEWICRVIKHTQGFRRNKYLLHTKNPGRVLELTRGSPLPNQYTVCVTIESNRWYDEVGFASEPEARLSVLSNISGNKMITVEPVMDFDVDEFSQQIIACKPLQVNIGANSGHYKLMEPSREKLEGLIEALSPFTAVHLKKNLRRLLPEHDLFGR